jgi:2-polyprenyl-3-methyl-5-hydroxy-6-metoxy-1,4-benzoquinol methylase
MSLELLSDCPICSSKSLDDFMELQDHSVSHGTFTISRCKKCSFLFTNPRPTEENIGMYYDSENYISHHDEETSLLSKVYNRVRKIAVKEKLSLVEKYDPNADKSIFDVGCGTGFFLKSCSEKQWKIAGSEPDQDARKIASENTGSNIRESIFHSDFANEKFTTITLWHVLEHVHKLDETLDWIQQHLLPNGTVLIAVPNPESYDASFFGPYWAAYDVPRHLYHFTRQTMSKVLQKHHFNVTNVKCMLFDSYYVSLLSNQYKYGKKNPINSLFTGTISNIKGFSLDSRNINSSSIIYIVKKK